MYLVSEKLGNSLFVYSFIILILCKFLLLRIIVNISYIVVRYVLIYEFVTDEVQVII